MTMPHERMRSLRWGWEVLKALEADLFREPQWIERATGLLQLYPEPERLERIVEASKEPLSASLRATLDEARELFEEVLSETGSSALRRDLQYTLRHFPSSGVAKALISASVLGRLDDWLSCESEY